MGERRPRRRRCLLRSGAIAVLALAAGEWLMGRQALAAPGDRPNIVILYADDLGYGDVRCYNPDRGRIPTPHVDRLAAEGVRFTDYHCTAASCSPSRGSIMTGRYPHNNGLIGLAHIGWEYNPGEQTMAMYLREAGYSTHLFGVQHELSLIHI